ncbi:MAG: hypothetical protein WBG48_00965 [Pricia sp.]
MITDGTITMVQTARYLGNLSFNKIIVLVGSFILNSEKNLNTTFNLGYAIAALSYLDKGKILTLRKT